MRKWLIGEICGDYKNIPDGNDIMWWYNRTILDKLLDMYRNFNVRIDDMHIAENVINIMSVSRNGVICETDFSKIPLPFNIPCNIRFSLNGEYPCSFRYSIVDRIRICDNSQKSFIKNMPCPKWESYAVSSPNKKMIFIIVNDNYILLWDNKSDRILWDMDLSEYTAHTYFNCTFNCAEFSADGNMIYLYAGYCPNMHKVTVDSHSGKVIECGHERLYEYNLKNEKILSENLKLKIFQQLPHFKNCDFRYAKFWNSDWTELRLWNDKCKSKYSCDDYRKYLYIMGAVLE